MSATARSKCKFPVQMISQGAKVGASGCAPLLPTLSSIFELVRADGRMDGCHPNNDQLTSIDLDLDLDNITARSRRVHLAAHMLYCHSTYTHLLYSFLPRPSQLPPHRYCSCQLASLPKPSHRVASF